MRATTTRHLTCKHLATAVSFAGVALASFSAQAADDQATASASGASSAAGGTPATVQELVVTAQKRSEQLVDVPISVSVVTDETLKDNHITSLESLQQVVPGFKMTFAGADSQPTIRGIGSQVSGPGLPSNVATYIDGFYRPNQITNNVDLYDITSVQVLKGPQGTLFGRNATGGAILITTKGPAFTPGADIDVSYGSYDETQVDLFGTAPITDKLAASVSLFLNHGSGWNRNLLTGNLDAAHETKAMRAKLLFAPSDKVRFELTFEHSEINDPNNFIFTNYRGESVGIFVPGAIVSSVPHTYSNNYPPTFKSNSSGLFLKSTFTLPWATLTSLTGAERQSNTSAYDVDGSSANIESAVFPEQEKTIQQEFDLASKGNGRLKWLLGAFGYYDASDEQLGLTTNTPSLLIFRGGVKTTSFAVFGDATYELVHSLFLTGGVRFSDDYESETFAALPAFDEVHGKKDFQNVSPRAVIRYQIGPTQNVYASFSEGYKAGGFNIGGLSTVPVRSESVNAFEVGYKQAARGWSLEAAGFYYDYKDLQVTAYQGPVTSLVNAAKARIYGFEVDGRGHLFAGLSLDLGLSYVNARYTSFPGAPHYTWSPVTGITIAPGDASGNPIVNSPDFTGSIGLTYLAPLPVGQLELNGNYAYQTKTSYDAFQETTQPAYGVLNLKATWWNPSKTWGIGVFCKNATDENYVRSIFQQPVAFSSSYAPPRIVGVEVTVHL